MKLSINEAKLTGLWDRNCATIQQVLILKFSFEPEKFPGLSRKGLLMKGAMESIAVDLNLKCCKISILTISLLGNVALRVSSGELLPESDGNCCSFRLGQKLQIFCSSVVVDDDKEHHEVSDLVPKALSHSGQYFRFQQPSFPLSTPSKRAFRNFTLCVTLRYCHWFS